VSSRYKDYPPASQGELDIIEKCLALGTKLQRLDDFMHPRGKIPMNENIAKLFAAELEAPHDDHLHAIILQVGVVPEFRDIYLGPVVNLLKKKKNSVFTGRAINALMRIVTPQDAPLVAELLLDKDLRDRGLLIPTYARLAKKSAIPVLRKLVGHADTSTYALHHLSILGDVSIENELLELNKHADAWRRKIARDGLKRIEKNRSQSKALQ
jgi:hypothetical protein